MNNNRRKAIQALVDEARSLMEAAETLEGQVRDLLDEEQEYFDAMPEGLQGGERGETSSTAIENLESAADALSEFSGSDVADSLEVAAS